MVAALLLLRATAAAAAAAPSSFCDDDGWAEVWADHFNGTELDTTSWTVDLNAGDSRVRDSQGTADNVYLEDGDLVLRSQEQSAGKWNYTSGAVQTMGKQSWKGLTRACVRARLPGGEGGEGPRKDSAGIWPAHWMMPDNKACWPSNGEIDIMEMVNGDGITHATCECSRSLRFFFRSLKQRLHRPLARARDRGLRRHLRERQQGRRLPPPVDRRDSPRQDRRLGLPRVRRRVLQGSYSFRPRRRSLPAADAGQQNHPRTDARRVLRRALLHDSQHGGGRPVARRAHAQDEVPDVPQDRLREDCAAEIRSLRTRGPDVRGRRNRLWCLGCEEDDVMHWGSAVGRGAIDAA